MNIEQLAEEAKGFELKAETLEVDADDARWDAARCYWAAVKASDGPKVSAAEFAKHVGQNVRHAQRMVAVWDKYADPASREGDWSFWDHYQAKTDPKGRHERVPDSHPESDDTATEEVTFRATRRTGFAKVDKCLEDAATELRDALAVARGLDLDGEQKDIIAERLAVFDVPLGYLRRLSESEPAAGIADEVEAYLKAAS